MPEKIGFVGVGRMGANMARRLKDVGYTIAAVYDVRADAAKELAQEVGAEATNKLARVTELSDVIITVDKMAILPRLSWMKFRMRLTSMCAPCSLRRGVYALKPSNGWYPSRQEFYTVIRLNLTKIRSSICSPAFDVRVFYFETCSCVICVAIC